MSKKLNKGSRHRVKKLGLDEVEQEDMAPTESESLYILLVCFNDKNMRNKVFFEAKRKKDKFESKIW